MPRRVFCAWPIFAAVLALPAITASLPAGEVQSDPYAAQVIKLIGDSDREFRAAGLEQVRTGARGTAFTSLFAAELTKLNADGQVALLDALADRGDKAARPAVLHLLAASPDVAVRAAAISALGRLGIAEDVPLLVKALSEGPKLERPAAHTALTEIPGDSINKELAAAFQSGSAKAKSALIEVLATRRARDELPIFLSAAVDDNFHVRASAMAALGQLAGPAQLAQMLPGVLKAQKGWERDEAEKDVALVCERINDEDQRGAALIEAIHTVDPAQQDELLSLLGRVGGPKLLHFVAQIATGRDAARRQLGIEALSKWPDASVADKLFEIAKQATDPTVQDEAFRGFVKVSATRDHRSDKERLDRMRQALTLAKTPEQISLVLSRVRTAYSVDAVRFVVPYVDQPAYAQVACETIVEIAHHREVRDPNKAEIDKALDKVIATSKNAVVVERANRYKRGETWDRRSTRSR